MNFIVINRILLSIEIILFIYIIGKFVFTSKAELNIPNLMIVTLLGLFASILTLFLQFYSYLNFLESVFKPGMYSSLIEELGFNFSYLYGEFIFSLLFTVILLGLVFLAKKKINKPDIEGELT